MTWGFVASRGVLERARVNHWIAVGLYVAMKSKGYLLDRQGSMGPSFMPSVERSKSVRLGNLVKTTGQVVLVF